MRHPRGYGTFAKIIEEFVIKRKKIKLEEAIHKMTSLPAKTIGISKRGQINVGYFADLLVFDPKNVKANATYEQPHQLATGFDLVIINGNVLPSDKNSKIKTGKVLKKDN